MSAGTIVLYDDSAPVSAHARQLAGLARFGDLLFRGEPAAARYEAAARAAGWDQFERIEDPRRLEMERERIAQGRGGAFYLYLPASLGWAGDQAELTQYLRNLLTARIAAATGPQATPMVCGDPAIAERVMRELRTGGSLQEVVGTLPTIRPSQHLVDLNVEADFVTFLASAFAVRHFNAIESDAYLVRKSSTDRTKLKAEFDYYGLLPADLRMYFVSAFDFQDDGAAASYAMERLFVPDVAIQWVHGSFDATSFDRLLARLFHYLQVRGKRSVPRADAQKIADTLYLEKLDARLARLKELPEWRDLDPMLRRFAGLEDGLDSLVARYRTLYARWSGQRDGVIEIGHGDLCFSNILYGRDSELMKFIDARGASTPDDLYTDRYYDVAKLSHSILGSYDFINNGLFSIEVGDRLQLELRVAGRGDPALGERFRARLAAAGYSLRLVRLYEASLFISMLPLHIDHPRKLLAFAVTAMTIIAELEQDRARWPS